MRTFELQGRVTRFMSGCLTKIGFKNVKDTSLSHNEFKLEMKDGSTSKFVFLPSGNSAIIWGVADFMSKANDLKGEDWNKYYDESKFVTALKEMVHRHDANIGITWDTVEYYLNQNCKK